MAALTMPDDLRRFILTSIATVPHLEALLLLRAEPQRDWDGEAVAKRLYVVERTARSVLDELSKIGALALSDSGQGLRYRYQPRPVELAQLVDRLAAAYATNLVGITELIHSHMDRNAQQFADAFTWRKD